jgi:hypothetical protein
MVPRSLWTSRHHCYDRSVRGTAEARLAVGIIPAWATPRVLPERHEALSVLRRKRGVTESRGQGQTDRRIRARRHQGTRYNQGNAVRHRPSQPLTRGGAVR